MIKVRVKIWSQYTELRYGGSRHQQAAAAASVSDAVAGALSFLNL